MADRQPTPGLFIAGIKVDRAGIGGLRGDLIADQIEGERLIGQHLAVGHPGSAGAIKLRYRLSRAARAQIDRPQPECDARMVGIDLRCAPEKADRRLEIIDAHSRRPRLDQRVQIARRLGERDQRTVKALDRLAGQRLHHLARDDLLRGGRKYRRAGGQ